MLKLGINPFGVFACNFIACTGESVTLMLGPAAGLLCRCWGKDVIYTCTKPTFTIRVKRNRKKMFHTGPPGWCNFLRFVNVYHYMNYPDDIKPDDSEVKFSPVRPLPALQCTAATFLESADSQLWTSSQNGWISSMFGGVWSSNAYRATCNYR